MTTLNIVAAPQNSPLDSYDDRQEWAEVLAAGDLPIIDHPAFRRYCDLFFTFFKRTPHHVKRSYTGGFVAKTKRYKHKDGFYHPACLEGAVAYHLDPDKTIPYWLALRFGKKSSLKCIDLDNKDNVLGYYEYEGYLRPVVRLPLDHFKAMKRLYDAFPNHIWCVSSATLGQHIWEKLRYPMTMQAIERLNRPKLTKIGLGDIELYPSPQLEKQVHRRPFGLDYYTITDDGLLTFWTEQLDYFETERQAPAFTSIVDGLLKLATREWERCRWAGHFRRKSETPFASDKYLNEKLLHAEVAEVKAWVKAGCPSEEGHDEVIAARPENDNKETVLRPVERKGALKLATSWSWQGITELARLGVPEENKLYQYLLLLARPLLWREYYSLNEQDRLGKVEDDLLFWVLNKHNGLVTRVQQGNIDNIRHEIKQQVSVALKKTAPELRQFYAKMRANDRQYPDRVERIADLIRNRQTPLPLPVCCRCINKDADDRPVPDVVMDKLDEIVKDRRMRRRDGEYPFVRFARRLLNALWSEDGAARLNRETLLAFCASKNPNQQGEYKKLMAQHGLISDQWAAYVERGKASALYEMTSKTFEEFQRHCGTAKIRKKVEGRFVITSLTDKALAGVDFGW